MEEETAIACGFFHRYSCQHCGTRQNITWVFPNSCEEFFRSTTHDFWREQIYSLSRWRWQEKTYAIFPAFANLQLLVYRSVEPWLRQPNLYQGSSCKLRKVWTKSDTYGSREKWKIVLQLAVGSLYGAINRFAITAQEIPVKAAKFWTDYKSSKSSFVTFV